MARKAKNITVNLNLNVRGLSPSATLAINERSNELISKGKTVYKLGLGQSPFPVPEEVTDTLKKHAHQKDYLPVKGLLALREAVAEFNQRVHKVDSLAEDVMIGPGSKELIFILQLVYYGDILIPTPGWVSYSPQARIVGRHVSFIHTHSRHNWQLTPEHLDLICRTDPDRPRVLILNYPSNPTGCSYSVNKLKELADVARKYKVVIISDEIYGLLHHEGKHVSIARYYPEGTIISSGLSKWCGAGGWRLGTFSFPPSLRWLLEAMAIVASETFTATSAPIQYAAIKAFKGSRKIDHYLVESRRILKILASYITTRLLEMDIKVTAPDGAFYLFPDLDRYRSRLKKNGIYTSVELCERMLTDIGVAMLPGHDFGRDPEELTIRMAFVDFDGEKALHGSSTKYKNKNLDEKFVKDYCPKIVKAMDKFENWLSLL